MPALILQLTDAGLAAIQGEEGSDAAIIAELALSNTPFTAAPTLTALPGEFKRLAAVSGTPVAPNMVHMTARDTSADVYDATGLGLFLADGTLLAAYSSADPVLSKAQLAFALFAFDIAFDQDLAANIEFGNAVFLYPPATETVEGVARLATQAEVNAVADGPDDHETIVTPKTLRARLAAFFASVTAALDAMTASIAAIAGRTITGGGLVTGGGDLSANRVLTVTAASGAELTAATEAAKALTPAAFGALARTRAASGYETLPGGLILQWGQNTVTQGEGPVSVTFPVSFPNACFGPVGIIRSNNGGGSEDMWLQIDSWTQSGATFRYQSTSGNSGYGLNWFAVGY